MKTKQTILLKLTGEVLRQTPEFVHDGQLVRLIARQMRQLQDVCRFGIVIGGGNLFRGSKQGAALGLSSSVGHQVGMLATMMNGLILKDLFEQEGVCSTLFSAIISSEIGNSISNQGIQKALHAGDCLIFSGGTGNPFFTTDTTAVLRGLQIGASCIWKGTNINGIYSADPRHNAQAQLLKRVSYQQALNDNLKIFDATAFVLAKENNLKLRVFDIFKPDALIHAWQDDTFGSIVE